METRPFTSRELCEVTLTQSSLPCYWGSPFCPLPLQICCLHWNFILVNILFFIKSSQHLIKVCKTYLHKVYKGKKKTVSTENGEETAMGMCCWRPKRQTQRKRLWRPAAGTSKTGNLSWGHWRPICPDTCPATGAEDHSGRPAGCRSTGAGSMMEGKLLGEEARLESAPNSTGFLGHEVK